VQAVFFEKKWFITSQNDSLAYITSVPVAGKITLYGTTNNQLIKLYSDTSGNAVTSRVQTALMPMGDPIRTKQALKFGIEATSSNAVTMSATVDSERGSSPAYGLQSSVYWTNNNLQTISWVNNSNAVILWLSTGYELYKSDAAQYGKYLGLTVTSNSAGFIYNGFEFEHELRVRF
jgi:hypothetical protein